MEEKSRNRIFVCIGIHNEKKNKSFRKEKMQIKQKCPFGFKGKFEFSLSNPFCVQNTRCENTWKGRVHIYHNQISHF